MTLKLKLLKHKRIEVKINDNKTEFSFNYDRNDGTNLHYEVSYDKANKTVTKLIRYLNREKELNFKKDNFKSSADSDKTLSQELNHMLEDINNNAIKKPN